MTSPAQAIALLLAGRCHDPRALLGRFESGGEATVRVYLPQAVTASIVDGAQLTRVDAGGVFSWHGPGVAAPRHPRIRWQERDGRQFEALDAYSFAAPLFAFDTHLFNEGTHRRAWQFLGAHVETIDGFTGVRFCAWAPNAERLSVVGDFNGWDGRRHPLQAHPGSGLWSLFVPDLTPGDRYKFEIRNRVTGQVETKADPYARGFEFRPATASVVIPNNEFAWTDADWCAARRQQSWWAAPQAVYELHLGSWRRRADGGFIDYRGAAVELARHVRELGFTHVELMPITEHPFDASWGYQTLGFFAPTSRHGSADDLRWFIDHLHGAGIGVLLDWVPGHFPKDPHGLVRFDGSALYEHEDPRRGEHPDWNTLIFNYGRNEVRSFLTSSALYWLQEFHFDGLRVDAVASMLYLDYSRAHGQWLPNRHGGRENLEAVQWLKELNDAVHEDCPGALVIAEESTSWPLVTRGTGDGGLGFAMKWNMGWMHDTLDYLRADPLFRRYRHDRLTFGMLYAYSENFLLPLSHDEVVHGKGSLLGKMPGDDWQRFANLRLLYGYMWTYPGKKLLFMGGELAQLLEWNHDRELDWPRLDQDACRGVFDLLADLNRLYRTLPALHTHDFDVNGFEWLDCDDAAHSIISYLRRRDGDFVVVVINFTPVVRERHRVGVPAAGNYRELLNSDAHRYGGTNTGNLGLIRARPEPHGGRPAHLELTLPPLAMLVLQPAP